MVRGRFDNKRLERIRTDEPSKGRSLRSIAVKVLLIDSARIIVRDIDATNGIIHRGGKVVTKTTARVEMRAGKQPKYTIKDGDVTAFVGNCLQR